MIKTISRWLLPAALALAATLSSQAQTPMNKPAPDEDPLLWLEEVQGERALDWVRQRNAESTAALEAAPGFAALRDRLRAILDSRARIPQVTRLGGHLYNLWQDAEHPRGRWQRTTLAEYRKEEPAWELLLDLDELGRRENTNWVFKGADCHGPAYQRCLLKLSRGGADAVVLREFDLGQRRFVEGGFQTTEAKTDVQWADADTLYIGTDFGPGSMTESGYPRIVKRWRRGQKLADAATVFEGETADVGVQAVVDPTPGFERTLVRRHLDFYRSRDLLLSAGKLLPVPRPEDASLSFWREQAVLVLRSDWTVAGTTWPRGSLLVGPAQALLDGKPELQALFTPTARRSLAGWTATRTTLVLNTQEDVASRLEEWTRKDGRWQRRAVQAPFPGTLAVAALHDAQVKDDALAENLLVSYADFLTPDTLWLGRSGSDEREKLKARPSFFDAQGMKAEQRFATSRDGTRVPYFVIWPRKPREDGRNPTLVHGYGGFQISLNPFYSGLVGAAWLERGGVFVLANIRGGGEYGPGWHQAALKAERQRAFDDFAAVAEDLVKAGVTKPAHLGIQGGSNGGLLVGAVMLQRPELFGAVVCQVPLLDMKRYHKLLAGASWMAEYGNPDVPAEWDYIGRYSPYQNVRAGMKLPPVLFTTSTRDDRVHPGHARKMAERMRGQGHAVQYYENIEGGHAGAADNAQRARMRALEFSFLWQTLVPR